MRHSCTLAAAAASGVVSFGSDRPPWRPSRRLIVAGLVLLAGGGAAVAAAFGDRGAPETIVPSVASPATGRPCVPVGWAQRPVVAAASAGLVMERAVDRPYGLVRCDRTAADGPWTVVVRRPDGALGRRGAVVTFPVGAPAAGKRVQIGAVTGTAQQGMVTWPVGGAFARIRGDLSESGLVAIAARTTVADRRPTVDPPKGYAIITNGPYRSPAVHEVRYGSAALGEQAALGNGLTYTGMASGGGFEDQLYAVHARDGGQVDGRPAVVSPVYGGNATLAWEPAPGVVAYVGYSGAALDDAAATALGRLADRVRTVTAEQWQAINQQTVDQTNEPG
jgi:hypothetical protein